MNMPATPEQTVKVPVSLIEGLLDDFGNRRARAKRDARALLSQPTPTAERHHPACGALDEPCHCTERGDAAPPSIADMVPGTTFTGTDPLTGSNARFEVLNNGRARNVATWVHWDPRSIDPSTIRDVTPPSTESTK